TGRGIGRRAHLHTRSDRDAECRADEHGVAGGEALDDLDRIERAVAGAERDRHALGAAVAAADDDRREAAFVDGRRRHEQRVARLAGYAALGEEAGDEILPLVRDAHEEPHLARLWIGLRVDARDAALEAAA